MVEMVARPEAVNEPPDSVVTVAAPETFVVPLEILDAVVCPRDSAVTVPPEIELFKALVTLTAPVEIPPVMIALLENAVVPVPAKLATVNVPELPVKFTVPELLIPATERPVPEMDAIAPDATVMVAAEL
jgi:hypothetical protein